MILQINEVIALTRLSRVTIWRLEKRGMFPPRLQVGRNRTGWIEEEVKAWLNARPRGPKEEPLQLVESRLKRRAALRAA